MQEWSPSQIVLLTSFYKKDIVFDRSDTSPILSVPGEPDTAESMALPGAMRIKRGSKARSRLNSKRHSRDGLEQNIKVPLKGPYEKIAPPARH